MNIDTKIKLKRYVKMFSPLLFVLLGASVVIIGTGSGHEWMKNLEFYLMDDTTYKTPDGRFACWWIDEVRSQPSFQENSDFVKDLFKLHKDYCEDMPRP